MSRARSLVLPLLVAAAANLTAAAPPTFHKDVLPILQNHCQDCHRAGEVGPFSLTEFKEASKRAKMLRNVVESGQMPPWKPTDGVPILHDRRMSEKEIDTLKAWADAGAPEGDPKDAPPVKEFPKGWALGEPDLVLELPADVHLGATGDDHYRAVPLPTGLKDGKYVIAYEVRPGNARVLHHAVAYYDKSGTGMKMAKEAADAKQVGDDRGPGYESPMGVGFTPKVASDVGIIGGWAPGIRGVGSFPGTGMMLPKGADLVLQLHYHRTGKAETDRTRIGLYFAKKDVDIRPLSILTVPGLVSPSDDYRKFDTIPAGKSAFRVEGKIVVETDCELFTCTPHMHLLGRKIKVTMTPPGKATQTVMAINDWDFDWQEIYRLKTPIVVPAGTMFAVEGEYDNTAANPKNPLSPPRDAKKGEGTTDEMLFAFFRATPKVPGAEIKVKYLTDRKEYELHLKDRVYGRRDGTALTMDVFRPTGRPNGAAVVSVINRFFATAPEMIDPELYRDARARGYTVFAVMPGGAPRHTVPEMRDDLRRAVRFIRHNAEAFGIDPERIAATGGSSGGMLALHLGAPAPGDPKAADPVDRHDGQVRALAVLFPPTDMLNYGGEGKAYTLDTLPALLRGAFDFREFDAKTGRFDRLHDLPAAKEKVQSLYVDVSPIKHVTAKFAPTFFLHGDRDFIVPHQQSETMLAALKKAGVPAKLTIKPGGGHSWPRLEDDMPLLTDWLDEHLKK